jgi:endonuclease G
MSPVWRRLGVTVGAAVLAAVAALQIPGCSVKPSAVLPPAKPPVVASPAPTPASKSNFAQCAQHFPGYVPATAWPGQQRALCFDSFAVLHSGESKTPVYAVQRLTRASLEAAKGIERKDRFYPEARLPFAERAQLDDYKDSGYDRGHMAPAGDMPTVNAKAQSFSLADMVPQYPTLNQKDWNQIEQATRKYVMRAPGEVFVYTGPYFGKRPPQTIGQGKVWVPTHVWKLVYTPAVHRGWVYWMTNDGAKQSLKPITYQQFATKTGMRLLPEAAQVD